MITKAEILAIYADNTCSVRIPVFEQAGLNIVASATATIIIPPGIYNSYSVGDIVMVGFDREMYNKPVVLGKLYKGAAVENIADSKGAVNCTSLSVSGTAKLPATTELNYAALDINIDGANNSYKSITDIIKKLQELDQSIKANSQPVNIPYTAYAKTLLINALGYNLANLDYSLEQDGEDYYVKYKGEELLASNIIKQYMEYMTGVATDLSQQNDNKYHGVIIIDGGNKYYAMLDSGKLKLVKI